MLRYIESIYTTKTNESNVYYKRYRYCWHIIIATILLANKII